MKMSEAMRLGAVMTTRSATGVLHTEDGTAACALGAAIDGAGLVKQIGQPGERQTVSHNGRTFSKTVDIEGVAYYNLPLEWSPVRDRLERCPVCLQVTIGDHIISLHLNDAHRWDRLQIADWVEMIENRIEAEAAAEKACKGTAEKASNDGNSLVHSDDHAFAGERA